MLTRLFVHELKLAWFKRQDVLLPLGFYLMAILVFPLGLTADIHFLQKAASGIVMVSLLFAQLLSLERLFKLDFESGLLDRYRTSSYDSSIIVLVKLLASWLAFLLPLLLLAPIISILLNLSINTVIAMILVMITGTPFLTMIGGLGAALTLRVKQSALLLIVIILPLYIGPLVFMASAMNAAASGLPYNAELALLGAMSILSTALCPLLIGWIFRMLD
jgi:heme exporter protein B